MATLEAIAGLRASFGLILHTGVRLFFRQQAARASLVALPLAFLNAPALAADHIYFTDLDSGSIQRANLDGTDRQTILGGLGGAAAQELSALTVDSAAGHIYYSLSSSGIHRAGLDGSGAALIIPYQPALYPDFPNRTSSLIVNPFNQRLYIGDVESFFLFQADLDGANVQIASDVIGNDMYVLGFDVNPATGALYWAQTFADSGPAGIMTLTPPSHAWSTIFDHQIGTTGVGVDFAGGRVYWSNDDGRIQSSNLEGDDIQDLLTGLSRPFGLELDDVHGKLYWLETYNIGNTLKRSNLDGTGIETLLTGLSATDIYLDITPIPEPAVILSMSLLLAAAICGRIYTSSHNLTT